MLWACVIEVLTSWPNPPAIGAPAGTDKAVHCMLYGTLGLLTMRAVWVHRFSWRIAIAVAAGISLFGAADEWHQLFIPARSMELGDWIADTIGAMAGITLYSLTAGAAIARRESTT